MAAKKKAKKKAVKPQKKETAMERIIREGNLTEVKPRPKYWGSK